MLSCLGRLNYRSIDCDYLIFCSSSLQTEANFQRLTFSGRTLSKQSILADYNVQEGCMLEVGKQILSYIPIVRICAHRVLVLRLRGGMMNQRCQAQVDTRQEAAQPAQKAEEQKAFNLVYPGKIQVSITFHRQTKETVNIIVSSDDTVMRLKEMIEEKSQVSVQDQRLLYGAMELKNSHQLSEYRITHDSSITLCEYLVFYIREFLIRL